MATDLYIHLLTFSAICSNACHINRFDVAIQISTSSSRKTVALEAILEGLSGVTEKYLPSSQGDAVGDAVMSLWSANETITMDRLHQQLAGEYFGC